MEKNYRGAWLSILFSFIFLFACNYIAGSRFLLRIYVLKTDVVTTGTVLSFDYDAGDMDKGSSSYVKYSYYVEGNYYEGGGITGADWNVGEKISIHYSKKNPSNSGICEVYGVMFLLSSAGIILLIIFLIFYIIKRKMNLKKDISKIENNLSVS